MQRLNIYNATLSKGEKTQSRPKVFKQPLPSAVRYGIAVGSSFEVRASGELMNMNQVMLKYFDGIFFCFNKWMLCMYL